MKMLFAGCSFFQGVGLDGLTESPANFANIVGQQLNAQVTNISQGGNSNERIFLETVCELAKKSYDVVVVGWTSYPRLVVWPGLELYNSRRSLCPIQQEITEHQGNDVVWSSKEFKKIKEWFMTLTHDHYYILDICRYVNSLKYIVEASVGKVYFVNTLAVWDSKYFEQFNVFADTVVKPDMLTKYTNQLLNSDNRDDEQINALFHVMGQDYRSTGGIQSANWINLYNSLNSNQIDLGNDNHHPGPLSHQKYAELIVNHIN